MLNLLIGVKLTVLKVCIVQTMAKRTIKEKQCRLHFRHKQVLIFTAAPAEGTSNT